MCGFAGFAGAGDETVLRSMCAAIAHRGPDDESFHHDGGQDGDGRPPVRLGFRRLAIIDIDGGRQPMATAEGDLVVVYNGEIYNAPELRRGLEQAGHRFRTDHSDTEVLLHGYRQWGDAMVDHLNGMFAFCLYDRRRGRLLLARDPFGKKPLFYARTPDGLVFASEATAVRRHPAVPDGIDRDALVKYFAYGFLPAPLTLHRAVRKLPGGSVMTYDLAEGRLETRRYWEYRMAADDPPPGGVGTWIETVRDLLDQAVGRRLMSDVPLGFFLSGGVDSTAVVAFAARRLGGDALRTFTIGFSEPSYDESGVAAGIARHYGTDHQCRQLDLDGAAGILPGLLARVDDPIADPSILPTHLLSGFARERVKVALTGDGGDELFAGYDTFDALRPARLYHRMVPRPLHRLFEAAAGRLPRSDRNMSLDFKLRRALRGVGGRPAHWMPAWLGPASVEEIGRLFGGSFPADALYEEAAALWDGGAGGDVDRSLEFYGRFYLGENLLIKADRATMLCSLEARSPFLDRDLVAYVRRLPASVKLRGGTRKWILKQAVAPFVPEAILKRPKKGFGIPVTRWLRHLPPPPAAAAERLGLDGGWLNERWKEHQEGRADHRGLLWAWTALAAAVGD
ncbi:asparagine synthase (glutamine-hydrolyzing) [Azospirillum doebereinerae]